MKLGDKVFVLNDEGVWSSERDEVEEETVAEEVAPEIVNTKKKVIAKPATKKIKAAASSPETYLDMDA
jgi:hypothetical protein